MKFVEPNKMSKKQQKELAKAHRVTIDFNTGSRSMKSAKYPSRAQAKSNFRKEIA